MKISNLFEQIIAGQALSKQQIQYVMQHCFNNQLSDVQLSVFLALMRMKGETIEELTAAALEMKGVARSIDLGPELIDIVGTGGDGKNTFNVSTVSSFVVAASNVCVAKHGNRSASSRSGSADMLASAGFILDLPDHALKKCIKECQIAFLLGPNFHPMLKQAQQARQQLGIRTLFNIIPPLLNPAGAKKQVVGVAPKHWLETVAQLLATLGSEHAIVIHSRDGLDEVSISGITDVVEFHAGTFKEWRIDPRHYDCFHPSIDDIVVQSAEDSLKMARSVFAKQQGPARDMTLLNAGLALYCADACASIEEGIEKAAETIDAGLAEQKFIQLRDLTQVLSKSE